MLLVLLVALGGVVGSLARYAVLVLAPTAEVATLLVNLTGCLLIGVLVGCRPGERVRAFAGTGLLGGFTTMSAFAVEVVELERAWALGYAAASIVGGLTLCRLGLWLAHRPVPPAEEGAP